MLRHVNNDNFESEILKNDKVVIADFFATWCGPCQMLIPVIEEIAKENENFDVAKINVDDAQELAVKYLVDVVPTMLIFKNGEVVDKMEGFNEKSKILDKVAKYLD